MEGTQVQLALQYINETRALNESVELDGNNLTIPKVIAVCEDTSIDVKVNDQAVEELEANVDYLKKKLDKGLVVYGINTGFGGSAEVRSWKLEEVQTALIRHVNAGMGRVFPNRLVRAAMLTRANCLTKGYSGVRPAIPRLMVEMINHDIMPCVPIRGSVSASGDLMPLGYIAAAVVGREDLQVTKKDVKMHCPEALKEANLKPLVLGPKEGLAIINADSFAAGVSAPILYDANIVLLLSQICTGLSVEALNGRTESFHPVIHNCLPHVGQKEIANNMLSLLEDSKIAITTLDMHLPDKYGVLKQDRYSLRSAAQWLGPVAETLKDACRRITIELNSANDNPIIDHRTDTIAHGANFQGETMSIAMDQTRQVIGVCGKLLFAQFAEVVNAKLNFGLPPNLSGCDINIDFGFKGCDTAMASYMSELDHFVNPMSNHVLSAETHNQSVNSMALVSARLTAEAIEIIQMMVANLLCLVSQAVDLRYLRSLVLHEIALLVEECPEISVPLKDIEWYELIFRPEEVSNQLCTSVENGKQSVIQDYVLKKISKIYKTACTGQLVTASRLGRGTSMMYKFIREELDIPFYCGQFAIDTWLNQILKSIQGRDIETVLLKIFSPLSENSMKVK